MSKNTIAKLEASNRWLATLEERIKFTEIAIRKQKVIIEELEYKVGKESNTTKKNVLKKEEVPVKEYRF